MKKTDSIIIVGVLLIAIFCSIIQFEKVKADAATIYVDDSGGQDYTKIKDAIDAASSGDTVYVYSGTYDEKFVIDKSINLIGENRDTTKIDGDFTYDVINVSAENVKINGFTITLSIYDYSACILVNSDDVKISNNIIKGNKYGIVITSSSNVISDNIIINNDYGIKFSGKSNNNEIKNNNVSKNSREGIISYSWVNNSIITGNSFFGNNGGLTLSGNNNTVSNNVFTNNNEDEYSFFGQGITLYGDDNNIFGNIISDHNYCGIKLSSANRNNISNNILTNNDDTGVLLYKSIDNTISKNEIKDNNGDGINMTSLCNDNEITGNVFSGIKGDDVYFDSTCKNNEIKTAANNQDQDSNNININDHTNDQSKKNNNTPGFELIFAVAAIAVIYFIKRKKHL